MNKGEKLGKSFKICDITQLGPNLKNATICMTRQESKQHMKTHALQGISRKNG